MRHANTRICSGYGVYLEIKEQRRCGRSYHIQRTVSMTSTKREKAERPIVQLIGLNGSEIQPFHAQTPKRRAMQV